MLIYVNLIFKLFSTLNTKRRIYSIQNEINPYLTKCLDERTIVLLWMLQVFKNFIFAFIQLYFITVVVLTYQLNVQFLMGIAFYFTALLYYSMQVYKARSDFQPAIAIIQSIVPLSISLWNHADIVTDIIQLMYYRKLATSTKKFAFRISWLYFYFSAVSLTSPVLFCFIIIICSSGRFQLLGTCFRNSEILQSNKVIGILILFIDIMLGIPAYIPFAIITYYIIIPITITKNGLDIFRKGEDKERWVDGDPLDLVSRYSNSKGILE